MIGREVRMDECRSSSQGEWFVAPFYVISSGLAFVMAEQVPGALL